MGTQTERIQWAIVGIGVNLFHRSFPGELASTATSLSREGIRVPNLMAFCRELTHQLERTLSSLEQGHRRQLRRDFQEYVLVGSINSR
jgi:BirA family biotin operon repressor/biotin-[acetyl-CoA-carboxylase] ligase